MCSYVTSDKMIEICEFLRFNFYTLLMFIGVIQLLYLILLLSSIFSRNKNVGYMSRFT